MIHDTTPPYTVRVITTDEEMKEAYRLRFEVFVDEQHVNPENELDSLDPLCTHFLIYPSSYPSSAIGTARLLPTSPTSPYTTKIGRVCIRKPHRRHGAGAVLMSFVERTAREKGVREIEIHAQIEVERFYREVGYERVGEGTFWEEGIEHAGMRKVLV
ncbi:hypothetical protein HDV00_007339 [Rhizophlyctis rosea]|nr:hypothetical protein HDV00_007339 [Rhizophlyctis rosea]